MLGEAITNAALEGTGEEDRVDGVGLLPTTTRFDPEKTVEAVTCELSGVGPPAGANGEVSGYEIHAGETEVVGDVKRPFIGEGAGPRPPTAFVGLNVRRESVRRGARAAR